MDLMRHTLWIMDQGTQRSSWRCYNCFPFHILHSLVFCGILAVFLVIICLYIFLSIYLPLCRFFLHRICNNPVCLFFSLHYPVIWQYDQSPSLLIYLGNWIQNKRISQAVFYYRNIITRLFNSEQKPTKLLIDYTIYHFIWVAFRKRLTELIAETMISLHGWLWSALVKRQLQVDS